VLLQGAFGNPRQWVNLFGVLVLFLQCLLDKSKKSSPKISKNSSLGNISSKISDWNDIPSTFLVRTNLLNLWMDWPESQLTP
jgi:hypothetical protein